jgi:hypothetical protein
VQDSRTKGLAVVGYGWGPCGKTSVTADGQLLCGPRPTETVCSSTAGIAENCRALRAQCVAGSLGDSAICFWHSHVELPRTVRTLCNTVCCWQPGQDSANLLQTGSLP